MDPEVSPPPAPAPVPEKSPQPSVLIAIVVVLILIAGGVFAYAHYRAAPVIEQETAVQTPIPSLADGDRVFIPADQAGQWTPASDLATTTDHGYYWNNNDVVYYGSAALVPTADNATFTAYKTVGNPGSVAKDKNVVWFDGKAIPGADPASFTPIVVRSAVSKKGVPTYVIPYIKDSSHVWRPNISDDPRDTDPVSFDLVAGADPATFTDIGGSFFFGEDANHVYSYLTPISDDPTHFRSATNAAGLLSNWYYVDSHNVYYSDVWKPILNADPATFVGIFTGDDSSQNAGFAKDKNQVYVAGTVMSGADVSTFALLMLQDGTPSGLAKDSQHIYDTYYDDTRHTYAAMVVPGIAPDSFKIIGEGANGTYATDGVKLYYLDAPAAPISLSSADLATFVTEDATWDAKTDAHDKNHEYLRGKIVK